MTTTILSSPHDLLQLGREVSPAFFLRAAVGVFLLAVHISLMLAVPQRILVKALYVELTSITKNAAFSSPTRQSSKLLWSTFRPVQIGHVKSPWLKWRIRHGWQKKSLHRATVRPLSLFARVFLHRLHSLWSERLYPGGMPLQRKDGEASEFVWRICAC